jgi:tetratricopeptide (TPR) repeat protein
LLAALAVLFLVATALTRNYKQQRTNLGMQWFTTGEADLSRGNAATAVEDFRNALAYSRSNPPYELELARALLLVGRTEEARAYLESVWQVEPENAVVNLQLARIAAREGAKDQALRYFHSAVYGVWLDNADANRRQARRELIDFLLHSGERDLADAELLALANDLPRQANAHVDVGSLLLEAGDYSHALAEFRTALSLDRHNSNAAAGAGEAEFHLGRYGLARTYLRRALASDPANARARDLVATSELVLNLDPLVYGLTPEERDRRVHTAFVTASARLDACAGKAQGVLATQFQDLRLRGAAISAALPATNSRLDPTLVNSVMDFVFAAEEECETACGPPTGADLALLLIAGEREPVSP